MMPREIFGVKRGGVGGGGELEKTTLRGAS